MVNAGDVGIEIGFAIEELGDGGMVSCSESLGESCENVGVVGWMLS
jgi:hypothetical protein